MYLDEATAAVERGDAETALNLCEHVLAMDSTHPRACYIAAECYRLLRFLDEAEQYFRLSIQRDSGFSPVWSGLGAVLFDQLRFQEAERCQYRAIQCNPNNPEAYYHRALLRERKVDPLGAERDYRRAYRMDPHAYPKPVSLEADTILSVLTEAIDTLHPSISGYLSQISIKIQDVPEVGMLRQYAPPAPPSEMIGYFSGLSVPEVAGTSTQSLPGTFFLFQKNLERIAWDKGRIVEELRATVFAELGDYLGLTEKDLVLPRQE